MSNEDIIKYEFLKKIVEFNKITPGIWYISSNIIKDSRYTLIIDKTLIISVYELTEKNLIILYKMLNYLKSTRGIVKVINKKEFLIIKLASFSIVRCFTNNALWKLIEVEDVIKSIYSKVKSKLYEDYLEIVLNDYILNFKIVDYNTINCLNLANQLDVNFSYCNQRLIFYEEIFQKLKQIEK